MADKYARGKIYKIISTQTDGVYIGSTTRPRLSDRMCEHRRDYKKFTVGGYDYLSSYEIMQYPDARIILVESFPCETRDHLRAREQ